MGKTLGLDIGTNSIGWALVDDGVKIIDSGVRIFPVGVKEEDFLKNGSEVSKNVARRTARGIRRRYHRYKLRRERLNALLSRLMMLPDEADFFTTRELYELRAKGLDEQLTLKEFGRILTMLNKRRGFKSNRKTLSSAEEKKEEGKVKEGIAELQKDIIGHQCRTVGEYFAFLFRETEKQEVWHSKDEAIKRIRGRFVGREMYIHEFDTLWEKQTKYYPSLLTVELRTKIRDEIIYYQRNLKSQKGTVARCRFEPTKRCCPKSSVLFQEFRIWQQLASVRFASGERIGQQLTIEEKKKAFTYLMIHKKMSESDLKKLLGIPRNISFNDVFDFVGNTTNVRIIDAIGEKTFNTLSENQSNEIWHILTYTDNTEKLKTIVRNKIQKGILPSLSEEMINAYAETNLEDKYGNFSAKALKKILPHLRSGLAPFDAFLAAGYDPTKKILKGVPVELPKLPPLQPNELRNPIVQQMVSETFRVVNAVVSKYGKPDMLRVEMARELKKPKEKREEARNKSIQKRKQREEYAEFLSTYLSRKIEPGDPEIRKYELWLEMGCEDHKLDDLDSFLRKGKVIDQDKYRLWKECGRISPYSGRVISLTKLFSSEIEIEHILPYSQTMNSEFTNLCLCESAINKEKGDMLPLEYFAAKGEQALTEFKNRVSVFKEGKRNRFLAKEIPEDFLNNQLINTSYTARELASRLSMFLPPLMDGEKQKPRVQVVNGQATGVLRRLWALNAILSKGDIETKNRGDHRHHAIDAIVIACTSVSLMQTLARYSKFDGLNKLTNDKISQPWNGFMYDVDEAIGSIIVSYRNQKRLIGSRPNKSKQKNREKYPDGYLKMPNITIRGPIHEEKLYGLIEKNGEPAYVIRWPINKFTTEKQLKKIVDEKVKETLLDRVKKFDGDVKKAVAENPDDPVLMFSDQGYKIPIKSVRIVNPTENLIQIRPNVFVESGNNYAIAIYEDKETGKRDFTTISFWEATQKALKGVPIVDLSKNGKPLLFVLQQKDIVVRYDEHPDEIEWDNIDYLRPRLYRVRKFDVVGQIFIDYLYASVINSQDDRNRLYYQLSPNTMKLVKIEVDLLGDIIKKEGI